MIFLEYHNVLPVRGQKNGWMSIRFPMKTVILWRIVRRLRSERTGMDGAGSSLMNVAQGLLQNRDYSSILQQPLILSFR